MGFYGLLVVATALISVALAGLVGTSVSGMNDLNNQFVAYSNIEELQGFQQLSMLSHTGAAGTSYPSWLSAMQASAYADDINLSITNSTEIISTTQDSGYYSVIKLD